MLLFGYAPNSKMGGWGDYGLWGMTLIFAIAAAFAMAVLAVEIKNRRFAGTPKSLGGYSFHHEAAPSTSATRPAPGLASNDNFSVARYASQDHHGSRYKRFIDITASIALAILAAPLLALTALAIRLDSPGPVFYSQKRVGFKGQIFEVYKFRSMIMNAEPAGPQYAVLFDNRVTRVGRFIRKFRIDEIPQTVNVLRGEMSFVGPRPERPEFVKELEKEIPDYHARHVVKPGITGWAQVEYEYAATVEGAREKLRHDLFYIQNSTPLLDILIILKTVRVALFGIGSR